MSEVATALRSKLTAEVIAGDLQANNMIINTARNMNVILDAAVGG